MPSFREEFPDFGPITWRKFCEMQARLASGEAAFLIGAGADMELAEIAGWTQLLNSLIEVTPKFRDLSLPNDFQAISKDFPAELAYLIRWNMGDQRFLTSLNESLKPGFRVNSASSYVKALAELLSKSNLIVTTNYTGFLKQIISLINRNVIIRDREELSTFNFPSPGTVDEEIYLVHLHGRCSESSFPVLDAWGYNIAREDSQEYMGFLRKLFSERYVIIIGSSLQDVPLRDAAAFVKRKSLYSNRVHISFYCNRRHSKSSEIALKNAMRGALGIELIPVTQFTQAKALDLLRPLEKADYPEFPNFHNIAEFLENTGDYDCELQHKWLQKQSETINAQGAIKRIRIFLDHLHAALLAFLEKGSYQEWVTVARLEKHLRHQRFLYFGREDKGRKDLWVALVNHSVAEVALQRESERSQFDFLVAQYELDILSGMSPDAKETVQRHTNSFVERLCSGSVAKERFRLAERVWSKEMWELYEQNPDASDALRPIEVLQDDLLVSGWESIAAKISGDKVASLAKVAQKVQVAEKKESRQIVNRILDEAERTEGLARQAGSFWRNFKPSVLRACWTSNVLHARLDILGKIHAAKSVANPMLLAALVAGLVVCELKLILRRTANKSINEIYKHLTEILHESNLTEDYLQEALNGYWDQLVPADLSSHMSGLKNKCSGT
jgi:SIR2-like protein